MTAPQHYAGGVWVGTVEPYRMRRPHCWIDLRVNILLDVMKSRGRWRRSWWTRNLWSGRSLLKREGGPLLELRDSWLGRLDRCTIWQNRVG